MFFLWNPERKGNFLFEIKLPVLQINYSSCLYQVRNGSLQSFKATKPIPTLNTELNRLIKIKPNQSWPLIRADAHEALAVPALVRFTDTLSCLWTSFRSKALGLISPYFEEIQILQSLPLLWLYDLVMFKWLKTCCSWRI